MVRGVGGLSIRGVLEALHTRGPAHAARRRRRDPGDARAQAHLGQEGRAGGVARRAPRGAPVGMRSTATMMYGHVETPAEIVEHFDYIRALQDETHGFTAFVPWSYKRGNTPMESKVRSTCRRLRYLRVLAASRLYLDNFDHIQATWFSEGKKTGQIALHFGADDFGGTLFEENVISATGHLNTDDDRRDRDADPRDPASRRPSATRCIARSGSSSRRSARAQGGPSRPPSRYFFSLPSGTPLPFRSLFFLSRKPPLPKANVIRFAPTSTSLPPRVQ